MQRLTIIFLCTVVCSNSFADNASSGAQIVFTNQLPNPVYYSNALTSFIAQLGSAASSWWPLFSPPFPGRPNNQGGCNGTTNSPSPSQSTTENGTSVRSHPAARHVHKAGKKHHDHTKNHQKEMSKSHAHEKNNHHGN